MKTLPFQTLVLSALAAGSLSTARACDLCACPTPNLEIKTDKPIVFYASVSEQFTHFGSLQLDGHRVDNPTGQYMNSSITHLVLGASILDNRLALQLNLPFISRSYKRPEGFAIEHGTVGGFGDMSVLANYTLFRTGGAEAPQASPSAKGAKAVSVPVEPSFSASVNLIAGLKFPTGDTSRIKEEFHETEVEGAPESGIHGHDLTLGTGSWDGVFGISTFMRYKSVFLEGEVQYTVRGAGDYGYRFANDLTWSGGPGVYLVRDGDRSIALQAAVSGEYKGKDTFNGESAEDTGITALYLGPRVLASVGRWSASVGCDWPVILHNTSLQSVPDFRIRADVSFHF